MIVNFDALMSAWGWALIQFLWQGTIIGVIAILLLRLMRQAKPQVRYLIAVVALGLCLLIPIMSTLQSVSLASTYALSSIHTNAPSDTVNALYQSTLQSSQSLAVNSQIQWMTLAWLLGCVFFTLRMMLGLTWISQTQRNARHHTNSSLQSTFTRLIHRFGINRHITLLLSDEIESPMTTGWWKPIILVPSALLTQVSPEYLEALIAHELAHIKRFDYLINLLQSLIEIVLFFHPVVWWLSKQIRAERENIADDLAAHALGNPHRLAAALAALDQFQLSHPLLAQAAHGGNLMSRIQRLVKPKQAILNWKVSATLIGMVLACLTVYASATTSNADNSKQTANSKLLPADEVAKPENASSIEASDAVDAIDDFDTEDNQDVTINNSRKNNHESYAVVIAGKKGMMFSGNTDDFKTIEAVKKTHSGDFLWFKRDKKAYIIQDPATLAKVQAAWKDSDKLSAEMDALSDQMDVHSQNMDVLSKKMDTVSGSDSPITSTMEKLSRNMDALSVQQDAISRVMDSYANKMVSATTDAERDTLAQQMDVQNEKMEVLSLKMESLAKLMDAQSVEMDKALQPLDALSKEMDAAAKPMEALGNQMDALGRQMEVLSQKADRQVLALIDQSLKNGQAKQIR